MLTSRQLDEEQEDCVDTSTPIIDDTRWVSRTMLPGTPHICDLDMQQFSKPTSQSFPDSFASNHISLRTPVCSALAVQADWKTNGVLRPLLDGRRPWVVRPGTC